MAKEPPQSFWKDDLGLNVDELVDAFEDNRRQWVSNRTGRQVTVMCETLGIECRSSRQSKLSLLNLRDELGPFLLVEHFARFKSKIAVLELAREVLPESELAACMKSPDDGDKTALLFAIYRRRWEDLKKVALLDRTHKVGFAPMRLRGAAHPAKRPLGEFLKPGPLKAILADADAAARDKRKTEYRGLLERGGRIQLFVRRADRPNHMVRPQGGVIHGFKPEWIILDFEPNGKSVRIASRTSNVPLAIANGVASAFFNKECEYVNTSETTSRKMLEKFLAVLRTDGNGPLVLVEAMCTSTPLRGSPNVCISHSGSRHIGESLSHFEKAIGRITLDHIDSVKVLYRKKRVTLIFERAEDDTDTFDVRYSDHRLNALERGEFVTLLQDTHGITIHSTEKRYARAT